MGTACRVRGWGGFEISPLYGPPFYWVWMTMIGGTSAIAIMMMFHARGYLAETIRLAMRGGGKATEEEGEPFTYKQIYMFIVASAILVLVFCFSAGLSMGTALSVLIVGAFIDTLAAAYVLGLSGCAYIHNRGYWPSWPLRFIWFDAHPESYTTDWVMSHTILGTGVNHVTMGLQTGAYLTIQNIKMGGMGKINLRDIFVLTTVASVVAIFVANATRVWIVNMLGVGRVPIWGECSITDWCDNDFNDFDRAPASPFLLSAGGVGFLITMILSLLRAKFLWWPLHPVGFIIATSIAPNHMKEWTTFMLAWIVKWLTLRIGGSRAYGEIGVPLVSGGVAGYALSNLIAYVIGTVKFFVPF